MQPPTSSNASACGAIRLIISRPRVFISTRKSSARYKSEIMLGKKQQHSRRMQQKQLRRAATRLDHRAKGHHGDGQGVLPPRRLHPGRRPRHAPRPLRRRTSRATRCRFSS
eukprot:2363859-Pleurochrysis_carterae.AAC.1